MDSSSRCARERYSDRTARPATARPPGLTASQRRRVSRPVRSRLALDASDEPTAQAALDRPVSGFSLTAVLRDVVLPYLTQLRERWESGTASVALEHFASSIIRGRLAGLARSWGRGTAPAPSSPWPPGELRDLALMVFGIVLNRNGWRIDYCGNKTPVEELTRTVDTRHPDLVGASPRPGRATSSPSLAAHRADAPLALAEAGCEAACYLVHSPSDGDLSATMPAPPKRRRRARPDSIIYLRRLGWTVPTPCRHTCAAAREGVKLLGCGGDPVTALRAGNHRRARRHLIGAGRD